MGAMPDAMQHAPLPGVYDGGRCAASVRRSGRPL